MAASVQWKTESPATTGTLGVVGEPALTPLAALVSGGRFFAPLVRCAATAAVKEGLSPRSALRLVGRLTTDASAAASRREVHLLLRRFAEPARECTVTVAVWVGMTEIPEIRWVSLERAGIRECPAPW